MTARFKVVIYTQDYEYEGRIKAAGGSEYVALALTLDEAMKGESHIQGLLTPLIEAFHDRHSGDVYERGFTQSVIGWELMDIDALTPHEADQLEYDGRIDYPTRHIRFMLEEDIKMKEAA